MFSGWTASLCPGVRVATLSSFTHTCGYEAAVGSRTAQEKRVLDALKRYHGGGLRASFPTQNVPCFAHDEPLTLTARLCGSVTFPPDGKEFRDHCQCVQVSAPPSHRRHRYILSLLPILSLFLTLFPLSLSVSRSPVCVFMSVHESAINKDLINSMTRGTLL